MERAEEEDSREQDASTQPSKRQRVDSHTGIGLPSFPTGHAGAAFHSEHAHEPMGVPLGHARTLPHHMNLRHDGTPHYHIPALVHDGVQPPHTVHHQHGNQVTHSIPLSMLAASTAHFGGLKFDRNGIPSAVVYIPLAQQTHAAHTPHMLHSTHFHEPSNAMATPHANTTHFQGQKPPHSGAPSHFPASDHV